MKAIDKAMRGRFGAAPRGHPEVTAMIPVYFQDRPFTAHPRFFQVAQGKTIAEIVAAVPDLPAWFGNTGVVCVDGVEVPRELWARVRPRVVEGREIAVTLHLPLGNGKTLLGVLSVVVLVAALAVSQGALAIPGSAIGVSLTAGSIGAQLAAAGLSSGSGIALDVLPLETGVS